MGIPRITEEQIKQLCTLRSFQRGKRYYKSGAILSPTRQGNVLQAYCAGSRYEPYRVRVEFDDEGIVSAFCTCPYDWGGYCKHIVALLLTWIHEPESFREVEDLDTLLNRMSKEDLIKLIKRMIKREPRFEQFVGDFAVGSRRFDVTAFRNRVERILDRMRYEAPDVGDIEELVKDADDFFEAGKHHYALVAYRVIAEELLASYPELYDEKGELAEVIGKCIEGMGRCLPHVGDELRREGLLALAELCFIDTKIGGYDLTVEVPDIIAAHITAADLPALEESVFEAMAKFKDGWSKKWAAELLIKAYQALGEDEKLLSLCEEVGLYSVRAFKLLELGRKEEALETMGMVNIPNRLIEFAEALIAQGDTEAALEFVAERLRKDFDEGMAVWLAEQYAQRGKTSEAQKLWLRVFQEHPSLKHYRRLRELADKLGRWETLRPRILSGLEHDGQFAVLVDIYLDEGEHDKALDALASLKARGSKGWVYSYPGDYVLKVAEAVEKTHPREAIALYRELAEKLIEMTNRSAYREAVEFLKRARDLYRAIGAADEWEQYIAALRAQYPRRRALQEELELAGL